MFSSGDRLTIEIDDYGTQGSKPRVATPVPNQATGLAPAHFSSPLGFPTIPGHRSAFVATYTHMKKSGSTEQFVVESESPVTTSIQSLAQGPKIVISPAANPRTLSVSPPAYSNHSNAIQPTPTAGFSFLEHTIIEESPDDLIDPIKATNTTPTNSHLLPLNDSEGDTLENLGIIPTFNGVPLRLTTQTTKIQIEADEKDDKVIVDDTDWELLDPPVLFQAHEEQPVAVLDPNIFDEDKDDPMLADPYVIITFEPSTADYPLTDGQQSEFGYRIRMTGQYLGPKLAKIGLYAGAAIPPLALAANAFCAFPHYKTAELTWDKIKELPPGMLSLCIANAVSSYSINTILNLPTIRNAFGMFYDRVILHYKKHPILNTTILTLSGCAGIAMGGVAYASFSPLGVGMASANFATNAFIFFVTRFYGLVNALHRFEKWVSHNYDGNPLLGDSFADLLSHVTDECADELNQFLKNNHPHFTQDSNQQKHLHLNETAITELLMKLDELRKEDPSVIKDKTHAERFWAVFDLAIASGLGIAVLPVFAQKFLDGLDKLKGMMTGEASTTINELAMGWKALLSTFSVATSVLYTGQALLLRQTLINAYDNITAPDQSTKKKVAKGLAATGLVVGNIMASSSLYNLTETVQGEPNYIGAAITPMGSDAALANAVMGAAGALSVNGKLSISEALPAPTTSIHPIFRRTDSSAKLASLAETDKYDPDLDPIAEENDDDEDLDIIPEGKGPFAMPRSNMRTMLNVNIPAEHREVDAAIKYLTKNTLSFDSLGRIQVNHARLFKSMPPAGHPLAEPLLNHNEESLSTVSRNSATNRK